MGKINVKLNLSTDSVDDLEKAIKDGIRRGSGRTRMTGLSDEMESVAKARIEAEDAIWTGELMESFEADFHDGRKVLRIRLKNTADHAEHIEYGAQYTDRGPPVAALIPWVYTNMVGVEINDSEIDELPSEEKQYEQLEEEIIHDPIDIKARVPADVVTKAFWLQERIKERGLPPVGYMKAAREWLEEHGSDTMRDAINQEMMKS